MTNSSRFLFHHSLLILFIISLIVTGCLRQQSQIINENFNGNGEGSKNIFSCHYPVTDLKEFKIFIAQLARLKLYGRVDVSINNLAEKADFIIPEGGSPWHEYASCNGAIHVFFPGSKLTPFLPVDFIKKNQKLLLAKSEIVRKSGKGVTWISSDPMFLPEVFFEKYPHLRGPRVDHPRRSLKQEFTACFHQKETVEMYQDIVNELFENVPEINSFSFNINDSGSGLCWADLLYTGPNGPAGEEGIPVSVTANIILNIFKKASNQIAGHDIEIFYGRMLTSAEKDELVKNNPVNCYVQGWNSPPSRNLSSMLVAVWPVRGIFNPVRGIFNPVQIMKELNRSINNTPARFSFGFGGMYNRGNERIETIEKIIDIVEDNFRDPQDELLPDSINVKYIVKCTRYNTQKCTTKNCLIRSGKSNSDHNVQSGHVLYNKNIIRERRKSA